MTVGALVLAAGSSQRFGADKRRALLSNGSTVLAQTLNNISATGVESLVCIAPGDDELVVQLATENRQFLVCPNAAQGMGHTLAEAIRHADSWSSTMSVLADMPWVNPTSYSALSERPPRR